jgi:hypothetical protein
VRVEKRFVSLLKVMLNSQPETTDADGTGHQEPPTRKRHDGHGLVRLELKATKQPRSAPEAQRCPTELVEQAETDGQWCVVPTVDPFPPAAMG